MQTDEAIARVTTPEEVDSLIERLYGAQLGEGVVHVTAVWRDPASGLRTLAINEATPKSRHDLFVLDLARARSDALLTTGKILRDEPEMTHDLQSPAADALHSWRRQKHGKHQQPLTVVLTRGDGLDLDHPAFRGWTRPLVFTSLEARDALAEEASLGGIEVVGVAEPNARTAIDYLKRERGCRAITVEAGPSTNVPLYDDPAAIDELMLSVYEGESLDTAAQGDLFLDPERLKKLFPWRSAGYRAQSLDGPWSFLRLVRG
ncbi:MAG: dihydrofolate reductase family protein [Acidobacteriota bacterium]